MKILGGHILKRAMAVVGSQQIGLMRFTGRMTNATGFDVATYAAPTPVKCQVQGVNRSAFQFLGLDFNKDYVFVYSEMFIADLKRDAEADRFTFCGETFEVVNGNTWKKPQGFTGVLGIKIA